MSRSRPSLRLMPRSRSTVLNFPPFTADSLVSVVQGRTVHTITAQDGSWTTGALSPLQLGSVTFDKPGTYVYICKDHPWAMAQLIVVE